MATLAKRSRIAVIGYYLQKDLCARLAQRRLGIAPTSVRTGGGRLDRVAAGAYADHAVRAILEHSGLTDVAIRGWRVLEIGPGDDLATAALMLARGAQEVVALDRFAVSRSAAPPPGVTVTEGIGIEDAAGSFGPDSFDFIYSVAVLEHVADLDAAFASMYEMLRPGGTLGHAIGGGDHGMFSDGGLHPLTYMTLPRALYRLMTAHSGGPNRVLPVSVRRIVERYDWDWQITIGNVLGVSETLSPYRATIDPRDYPSQAALIESIRPRLREPFRSLPTSELLVEGCFLTARKTAPVSDGRPAQVHDPSTTTSSQGGR